MPKITAKVKDLDLWARSLEELAGKSSNVCKAALFDGAKIAADELHEAVNGLGRVPDVVAINAARRGEPSLLSVSQKIGLSKGLGVSPHKLRGKIWSVKIGFDGYNGVVTRRWPKGQPNRMVAASCEHGSSAMLEQPFIRPSFERCKGQIRQAMILAATEKINDFLKGE